MNWCGFSTRMLQGMRDRLFAEIDAGRFVGWPWVEVERRYRVVDSINTELARRFISERGRA